VRRGGRFYKKRKAGCHNLDLTLSGERRRDRWLFESRDSANRDFGKRAIIVGHLKIQIRDAQGIEGRTLGIHISDNHRHHLRDNRAFSDEKEETMPSEFANNSDAKSAPL
jgi:hypothetical protein